MCIVHISSLKGSCLSWCVRDINYGFKLKHVLVFVMIGLYNYNFNFVSGISFCCLVCPILMHLLTQESTPRIVRIGDNLGCPCGGTHVLDVSDITKIKVCNII